MQVRQQLGDKIVKLYVLPTVPHGNQLHHFAISICVFVFTFFGSWRAHYIVCLLTGVSLDIDNFPSTAGSKIKYALNVFGCITLSSVKMQFQKKTLTIKTHHVLFSWINIMLNKNINNLLHSYQGWRKPLYRRMYKCCLICMVNKVPLTP
jgi:hypothetical protein